MRVPHMVISFGLLILAGSNKIAAADPVTTGPSNAAVTLWDQAGGVGHSITFTGTGTANLANYLRDPANPGLGTWDHAVRSYQANDTTGTLRTVSPARSEQFGPNFNVKNAGQWAQNASQLIITWVGWNQHIQSGSIVNRFNEFFPPEFATGPFCMDTFPSGHVDDFGAPLVVLAPCAMTPTPSQQWQWDNGLLRNLGTGLCMDGTGQLNGVFWMIVLRTCTGGSNQTFSFDTQDRRWIFSGINMPITVFAGWPPSFGQPLNVGEPIDSDWDQSWLNYFY